MAAMRSVILPRGEREAVPRAVWVARVAATVAIIGLTAALVADVVNPPPAPLELAELGMCFIALDEGSIRPGAPSVWHAVRQCPALTHARQVAPFRIEEAQKMGRGRCWQRPCCMCAVMLRGSRGHRAKQEELELMLKKVWNAIMAND